MKQRAATTRALRVFLGSCEGRSPCLKKHNIYEGIVPFTFSPRRIWSYCAFSRTGSRNLDSTVRKLNMCNVIEEKANGKDESSIRNPKVIFVLGGPGSGKGTQCAMIVEHFGFTHLSAGDLLRDEIKSGSENGMMIQNIINEGNIVPSMVTVKLLQDAMRKSDNTKFLIDGFPRNDENRTTFEDETGIKPEFVLFFECTEQEMEKRLLGRNEGRLDDNIATIRKRFNVFVKSSLPVINHYESCGKVHKVNAVGRKEEVFEAVKPLFLPFSQKNA